MFLRIFHPQTQHESMFVVTIMQMHMVRSTLYFSYSFAVPWEVSVTYSLEIKYLQVICSSWQKGLILEIILIFENNLTSDIIIH